MKVRILDVFHSGAVPASRMNSHTLHNVTSQSEYAASFGEMLVPLTCRSSARSPLARREASLGSFLKRGLSAIASLIRSDHINSQPSYIKTLFPEILHLFLRTRDVIQSLAEP